MVLLPHVIAHSELSRLLAIKTKISSDNGGYHEK